MHPAYWYVNQGREFRRPYGYGRRPFFGGNAFLGGLVGGLGGALIAPAFYGGPGYGYGYPPYGGYYY